MGDRQRALALLTSACAQERRRGATLREQRAAAADLHTVRSRVFPSPRPSAWCRPGRQLTLGRQHALDCIELAFVEQLFDTVAGGVQQPGVDVERAGGGAVRAPAGTGGPRAARRGTPAATVRRGAASASRSQACHRPLERRTWRTGALRRAALPLQLLVPRRRLAPRGAGRRGGPARARGAGPHRPRRLLRRRPLRRGGPGGRAADGVRRRAHAHARSRRRPAGASRRRPRR